MTVFHSHVTVYQGVFRLLVFSERWMQRFHAVVAKYRQFWIPKVENKIVDARLGHHYVVLEPWSILILRVAFW